MRGFEDRVTKLEQRYRPREPASPFSNRPQQDKLP
jgi:hypothetical protein